MRDHCDRCDISNSQVQILTIPVQFPDENISYIQLCPDCTRYALKLVLEELLQVEVTLSEFVDEQMSRRDIFNNIFNYIKNK